MSEIIEHLHILTLSLPKVALGPHSDMQSHEVIKYKFYLNAYHKVCNYNWRPEDLRKVALSGFKGSNSGALLYGPRGCGKS
jgi:hypothetical protein